MVRSFLLMVLLVAAVPAFAGLDPEAFFRPDVAYIDGGETFAGPARGYANGGWTTFNPDGLPDWHGREGFHSSLWELSRFSGGREQGGRRPKSERVGDADIPLTDAMKADVRRFLEETRKSGGTLIVRVGYTWSDQSGCEPADFDIVLGHVRDLSKIMSEFDDVVIGVEAGVAGPWAEMHSSDYCRPEYMNRVLRTYCENLGLGTSVLVRTAYYISAYAGTNSDGLLAMLPFHDAELKRFGMYNDGYLGTWWDYGTWAGEWKREKGCALLKAFADHPYGGELAYVSRKWLDGNREKCGDLFDTNKWNIVRDWYDCHLGYLRNVGDKKHPLCAFIADKTFRCDDFRFDGMPDLHEYDGNDLHKFMYDHMGYRFVVRDARVQKTMTRGKKALVVLDVENTGFGKLLLDSRVDVVLANDEFRAVAAANMPRKSFSDIEGGARSRVPIEFVVPTELKRSGSYDIYVRVSAPTKDETSGEIPRRPIRLANKGMWNEELKANSLGKAEVR